MTKEEKRFDQLTPERLAKGDVSLLIGDHGGSEARSYGFSLDFYVRRRRIDDEQYMAGVRYAELWELAYGRHRHAQCRYGDPLDKGNYNPNLASDCEEAFNNAARKITPFATRQLLFHVCVFGHYAGSKRMMELRHALDDLAKHFGYKYVSKNAGA